MSEFHEQRAYFAAHAPEVPDWFTWENREPKPEVPRADKSLGPSAYYVYQADGGISADLIEACAAEVKEFTRQHQLATQEQAQWIQRGHFGRLVAWRWAYADAMMAGYGK